MSDNNDELDKLIAEQEREEAQKQENEYRRLTAIQLEEAARIAREQKIKQMSQMSNSEFAEFCRREWGI